MRLHNPLLRTSRKLEGDKSAAMFRLGIMLLLFICAGIILVKAAAPEFVNLASGSILNATEDSLFTFFIHANDTELNYPLNFTHSVNVPASFNMTNYNNTSALINFTPLNSEVQLYELVVTVKDTSLAITSLLIYLNISNVNDPPNITSYMPTSLSLDATENVSTVVFNYTAQDIDSPYGDNLTSMWIVDGTIRQYNTSNFTYVPLFCDSGVHNITVNVSDKSREYTTVNWTVTVINTNRPPVFNTSKTIPNLTWLEDTNLINNFTLSEFFYDNDSIECNSSNSDNLTFTASTVSNVTIVINQTTWNVSFYPRANWSGNESIVFYANDSLATTPSNQAFLNVSNVNDAPYLSIQQDVSWAVGFAYTEQLSGTDADLAYSDQITYSYALNNTFASFSMTSSGYISFTPIAADEGIHSVNLSVGDSFGLNFSARRVFTIIVNQRPSITNISNQTATENTQFNVTAYATDANSDNITFSTNYSRFSTNRHNTTATTFYFTPANSDVGNVTINITASDVYGTTDSTVFILQINDINNIPTLINISSLVAKINRTFLFYVNATDLDNDVLNFSVNTTLINVTQLTSTGRGLINFTPNSSQGGNYSINLSVRDQLNATDAKIFNLTITENRAPVLAGVSNKTASTGVYFELNITATDPDNDNVVITTNYTRFATSILNASTVKFYFTPLASDIANHTILITANDSDLGLSNFSIQLNISKVNHAPFFIDVANKSCSINISCTFNLTAYDIDSDSLTFSPNISIFTVTTINTTDNSTTVRFNFTPSNTSLLNYSVNVSVSDSIASNQTIFTIVINLPPRINSYAPTSLSQIIFENQTLPFNHTSNDPEGGNLTYSWRIASENATLVTTCAQSSGTNQSTCESNTKCRWSSPSSCIPINRYGDYNEQATTQNFTYSALYDSAGNYSLVLYVFDTNVSNMSIAWNLTVNDVNRLPVFGKKFHDTYANFSIGTFNRTNLSSSAVIRLEQNGSVYQGDGEFYSSIIDFAGASTELKLTYITWNGSVPQGTEVKFQTRTSVSTAISTASWSDYITSNGTSIVSQSLRYLQYRIYMSTSNTSISPNVSQVGIGFTVANKTWNKNTVLLNWIDLDDFFYDLDSDNTINISAAGNSNINIEIEQGTRKVHLRPTNNFVGSEIVTFTINDGKSNISTEPIMLTVITNISGESPSPTPLPSSGSGGGGGATSTTIEEVEKKEQEPGVKLINFKLINPGIPIYYKNGTIETPITLLNDWTEPLFDINLESISDKEGVELKLSEEFIGKLEVGERKNIMLSISTQELFGSFEIVVSAEVGNPEFKDSAKIIIGSIEKGEYNKSQVNTKIGFVRDLLSENPECLELNELLENAKQEISRGNDERAILILDSAIESCRYLITTKDPLVKKLSPIRSALSQIRNLLSYPVVYFTFLVIIFSVAMVLAYYIYRKPKEFGPGGT